MHDPGLSPCSFRHGQVGSALCERGLELTAYKLGQSLGWNQEAVARGIPIVAIVRDAAAGDQAVDMGVVVELLSPGMQNGHHANGGADVLWITGDLDDGVGGGFHQEGVAVALVGAQYVSEFLGHRDSDVEIAARQHLELARRKPALGLISMAFGTAPVLAGMIGIDLGAALLAAPEVAAERFGAAGYDVGDGAPMRRQHRRAPFAGIMSRQVVVREAAEDVRNLDHGR